MSSIGTKLDLREYVVCQPDEQISVFDVDTNLKSTHCRCIDKALLLSVNIDTMTQIFPLYTASNLLIIFSCAKPRRTLDAKVEPSS